jgi:hypothetical protein
MRQPRLAPLLAALVGLAAALAAVAAARAADCPAEAQGFRRLETADAAVAYRWEPAQLKVGQFFTAEVVACRASGSEPVGRIAIDATMPAHGHGMNYRPRAEPAGAGRYRFTGLMLHMPGTWRLTFDLFQGSRRTRLTEDVRVER